MGAPRHDDGAQRRARRRKLFQPAELRHGGQTRRVHLLDVSVAGALVHVDVPPPANAMVVLVCEKLMRTARVAWATDRRLGLSFTLPLSEAELAVLLEPKVETRG